MKRIPKAFKLMSHTISVGVVSRKNWRDVCVKLWGNDKDADACVGFFDPGSNTIMLLRQSKSQLSHAFWHEVTHAILYYLNHKLYANEQFVDTVAGCLSQVIETAE